MRDKVITVLQWIVVLAIVAGSIIFAVAYHVSSCESIKKNMPNVYAPARCIDTK